MRSFDFLLACSLLVCAFAVIPVTAYSGEAVNWYNQGSALTASGNYTGAIQSFDHAISQEPAYYEAWNGKADALNRAHRYSDALSASDQSIALNPTYVKGWINRGYILYNLGRYDDELLAYERAIQIEPTNAEAWFNKGYSLGGMGKWDEALKVFDRVEALDPAYPNLAKNQQIARQNLDASTPFYIKNAPAIAVAAIIIIGAVLWFRAVRKKN
jgi:tetratricopeptide (TPR) repeat protein